MASQRGVQMKSRSQVIYKTNTSLATLVMILYLSFPNAAPSFRVVAQRQFFEVRDTLSANSLDVQKLYEQAANVSTISYLLFGAAAPLSTANGGCLKKASLLFVYILHYHCLIYSALLTIKRSKGKRWVRSIQRLRATTHFLLLAWRLTAWPCFPVLDGFARSPPSVS
jgi:hypothetical protein